MLALDDSIHVQLWRSSCTSQLVHGIVELFFHRNIERVCAGFREYSRENLFADLAFDGYGMDLAGVDLTWWRSLGEFSELGTCVDVAGFIRLLLFSRQPYRQAH